MTKAVKRRGIRTRALAVLLLVCVLFSGCGIDLRNYIYTEASLKRVAAKSLKEKYGEEFVIHRAWDKSQTMFFVECSPKDDPEVVFEADIRKNGDGVVADGYTQGVIAKELDEILRDDFYKLFGECYTRARVPNYYNVPEFENPKEVTLEEYLARVELDFNGYYVYILKEKISEKKIDEEYEFFSQTLKERIDEGSIPNIVVKIYFLDNEMMENVKVYYATRTSSSSEFDAELDKYYSFAFGYPDSVINKTYEEYMKMRMGDNENE